MSVALRHDTIVLNGECGVEDGEALLRAILDHPGAAVDWTDCAKAHTTIVQVLLAAGIVPIGAPLSTLLRDLVAPALRRGNPSAA